MEYILKRNKRTNMRQLIGTLRSFLFFFGEKAALLEEFLENKKDFCVVKGLN